MTDVYFGSVRSCNEVTECCVAGEVIAHAAAPGTSHPVLHHVTLLSQVLSCKLMTHNRLTTEAQYPYI